MEKNNRKRSKKLRYKDIFIENKARRLNEIVNIKSTTASLISNPKKVIAKNKIKIIIAAILIIALLLSTMYNDIPTFCITLAFLIGICLIVSIFNAFKFVCTKDGINVSFGFQKAFYPYEKIKCIYLSKYDDYSFLHIVRDYNIVLKYEDNNGFLKELTFSTLFVSPQEVSNFINNFIVENKNSAQEINFERFKFIRRLLRILLLVAIIVGIVVFYFVGK